MERKVARKGSSRGGKRKRENKETKAESYILVDFPSFLQGRKDKGKDTQKQSKKVTGYGGKRHFSGVDLQSVCSVCLHAREQHSVYIQQMQTHSTVGRKSERTRTASGHT